MSEASSPSYRPDASPTQSLTAKWPPAQIGQTLGQAVCNRVAYQGVPGAYSEQVSLHKPRHFATVAQLFGAIARVFLLLFANPLSVGTQAALKACPEWEHIPCDSFELVFQALSQVSDISAES